MPYLTKIQNIRKNIIYGMHKHFNYYRNITLPLSFCFYFTEYSYCCKQYSTHVFMLGQIFV